MNKLFEFDKSTVVSRLNRWGRWKMASGVSLGYPSQSAFMRLGGGTNPADRFGDIDHECIETDAAVESLPLVHQLIVRVEYVLAYKDTAVKAHQCGVCKRSYHNYLIAAHEQVANKLNERLHVVHEFDINPLNCQLLRPATA